VNISQNRQNLAARVKNGVKMRSLKIAISSEGTKWLHFRPHGLFGSKEQENELFDVLRSWSYPLKLIFRGVLWKKFEFKVTYAENTNMLKYCTCVRKNIFSEKPMN
jgi:hypothetical protein